ncbi:MAG: M1 family metallopeptidase [Polyangiaceae bacterium]
MRKALYFVAMVALFGVALEPAHADSGALPAPPQDPAFFDSDAALPAHAEPVADYTLLASLDPVAHTIHGEGTIRWRNASSTPTRELWIHLYLNGFKNQKSVWLREPVGGARGVGSVHDWGAIDVRSFTLREGPKGAVDLWPTAELHRPNDEDETDVRVPLPADVLPGQVITLDMKWDDKLPNVIERTGYSGSFHFAGQWFPKVARLETDGHWAHYPFHHLAEFYADFGTYDVTLDVPANFSIAATGPVVEARIEKGRRIERHIQGDIHDFAWTSWDQFLAQREKIAGVDVAIFYPPGFRVVAEREMRSIRFALPHFGKRYGAYPYPVLTIVHPPSAAMETGGMEYPTLITTEGPWWGPPGVMYDELLAVHEFGHQWFYGMIASDEVAWPFLDEGVNSYAEEEALGAWRGSGSAVDLFGLTVTDRAVHAVAGNSDAHNQAVALPAYAFATGTAYARLVYSRTATIIDTMRGAYGAPAVEKALGRYARQQRYRHPKPDDFIRSFSEVLGEPAAHNLRGALFDKGWVDYVADGVFSQRASAAAGLFDRDGKRERVAEGTGQGSAFEGWIHVTRRGTLTFPVDIELSLVDGSVQRLRWDGEGDSVRLPYHGTAALRGVVIDPDHAITLDENIANNHASTPGAGGGSTRSFERIAYLSELFLQAISP